MFYDRVFIKRRGAVLSKIQITLCQKTAVLLLSSFITRELK